MITNTLPVWFVLLYFHNTYLWLIYKVLIYMDFLIIFSSLVMCNVQYFSKNIQYEKTHPATPSVLIWNEVSHVSIYTHNIEYRMDWIQNGLNTLLRAARYERDTQREKTTAQFSFNFFSILFRINDRLKPTRFVVCSREYKKNIYFLRLIEFAWKKENTARKNDSWHACTMKRWTPYE